MEIINGRPTVLDTILPCTKMFPLYTNRVQGTVWYGAGLIGYKMDDSSSEYIQYHGVVPFDLKAGSDIIVRLDCLHTVQNDSGVTKYARIVPAWGFGASGKEFLTFTTGEPKLIAVEDGVGYYTLQQVNMCTISGVVAGDAFGIKLTRTGADGDDTLVGDFWLGIPLIVLYTADKIGVT